MADQAPTRKTTRGRVAALTRSRAANDPELVEARRTLTLLKLEAAVKDALAAAPPLTVEQRERIAALLRAGGAAA